MESFDGKNVLVTGGAGFIGSNLTERLLNLNANVTCLDNLSTGKYKNIEEFISNPRFTWVEGDIRDIDTCNKTTEGKDLVFHQAALGSVPRSINDPKSTTDVNIGGFVNMLIAATNNSVKRFIYAASSSTYGDSTELPKREDKIGKPLSPYAITKYVDELYAEIFTNLYGIETIGLRYFNVFGKKQDPDGAYAAVIPKFIRKLLKGETPVIHGDGKQSRDFTHIENVIVANILAAKTEKPEAVNQIYNVACGDKISLNELSNFMQQQLAEFAPEVKNIEIKHGQERQGDIRNSMASVEKAYKILGYEPVYYVKDGVKQAIKWYYENLK